MTRYLRIYMDDQLALGVGWRELARRAQVSNQGTELGDALARVARGITEDIATFQDIMRRLGMRPSRIQDLAGHRGRARRAPEAQWACALLLAAQPVRGARRLGDGPRRRSG